MRSLMILKLLPSSLWNSTLRTVRTSLLVTVHVSHMLHQTFYWFQRYRTFVTYNLLAWTWQNKVLHTSTIVGSFLLVMGMIMTFCLLSYPWSSLSKLSLSPSIYLSESPCLDIIYSKHKELCMACHYHLFKWKNISIWLRLVCWFLQSTPGTASTQDFGIATVQSLQWYKLTLPNNINSENMHESYRSENKRLDRSFNI